MSTTLSAARDLFHGLTEQDQATELVEKACDEAVSQFSVRVNGEDVPVAKELGEMLGHVIASIASGAALQVRSMPEELTTTVAASLLGVSRPTLMKMIRAGELPSHKVASHTRVRRQDVRKVQLAREAAKREAFDRLRALDGELDE